MSDPQENDQILTQQSETIATFDADSEPAETPRETATVEPNLIDYPEPAETPRETAVREDILTANNQTETAVKEPIFIAHLETETETVPIAAEIPSETIAYPNYPTQPDRTPTPEPNKTRIWQIITVFLSGMLVGSVLSLGSFIAWRMYQERANLQIRLPADVPLPQSPSPVPAAPATRLPAIPPAPRTAQQPQTIAPSPNPTQIPALSGIPQLPPASPLPSAAASPALETAVTERVSFEPGATGVTLRNTLPENKSKRYVLECNSGQSMTVNVPEGTVSAAIIAPNGEKVATANSTTPWQGQLPSSGDYTIEISGDNKAKYGVKIEVK
ncbi:hypothetical protein [Microcoleus sp. herbarium14]|uniref:hypothetical protein n=1 Tax=Microcoleus sp. herbarium14 TaxID=3055439 RepID=UPI002FD6362D